MVSKNNQQWKQQQDAKRVLHYGIRKLSIGVASVLLGTVFYLQNGTAYADVNPMVNAGNDSVNVVNKDSGTSGLTGASSTSTGGSSAGSASSVVSAGDTTNLMGVSQASGSPAEGATNQANDPVRGASEPGTATPVGQVNAGADNPNVSVPNRQTNAAGNSSDNQSSANLSLSVNQNSNFNFSSLLASKVALTGSNNAVNGGFDKATWGTLDVNAWQGRVQGDYYQLTDYTGDADHVIVPNEADFAKAGISTAGKQVGVTSDLMHRIFAYKATATDATVAFSKTDNKMVKAIGTNWYNTWGHANDYVNGLSISSKGKLTKFDGTNLDVANVTNMSYMFFINQISDVSPLANWKVDNVTNMYYMFYNNQISDLSPLANWKVDNVKDMSWMFYNNHIIDLSPLANWKVDNVTNMSGMFENNHISNLSPLANWKVDKVTDMSHMFDYNYSTQTKNLQAKRVINFVYPEGYAGKKQNSITQIVTVPQKVSITLTTKDSKPSNNILDWVTKTETPQTPAPVYFQDYTVPEIKGLLESDKTVIAGQQADLAKPINVTVTYKLVDSNTNDAFALDSKNGLHEHANVNDNGGYDTDFWGTLDVSKFTTVKNGDNLEITGYTGDAAKVIIPNIADFEINNLDQGAKQVTISSRVMHQLAKNATRIGLSKTNNQKVVAGDAIWQDAFGGQTNNPRTGNNAEGGMWLYNPNLTAMDLHNLDTTNITNMSAMFNGGRNLNVVGDLSQWNTGNVTSMRIMFQTATLLTNIGDLDNWDTSKVTDMSHMFNRTAKLTNIGDLSKWQTGNVTNMNSMFSSATNLTNIGNLDNWNTSKVTDMSWMFGTSTDAGKQSHLINIGDLSNWNTSKVTDMHSMFANATNLTNIGNLDNWNTSKVTDMSWMFGTDSGKQSHLTNIGNLSKWQTDNVTDMSFMFANAANLTNIGSLDNWDTSKVIDMNSMFYDATNLTNIGDLSKWQTSNVTNMRWMFGTDSDKQSHLTNIGDLSKWQTGNVTNMNSIFSNATNLTNIGNLDNWNTSKVTDMSYMFNNATHLTNIGDLSKWQTGNVTNVSNMFYNTEALRHLNISNWDLTNLANKDSMKHMFANDIDLTVIANDLTLPIWYWYQDVINDADYFWSNHMAVITNVLELIGATGDIDSIKIDKQDASRSIFYYSRGSSDALQVLKDANQAYIKQYQNDHPGYTLNLAADVDQTDPIALANANFISAPREVQFTIAYYDLTGKMVNSTTSMHKVGETVSISLAVPNNYVLVSGQSSNDRLMRWGLNEADFLVEPKVTTTTQTKTVSRTIKVQTPDGQTNNVVQTVTFVRNGYVNQVTKQTTYSPWSFGGQYQFSGYQSKPVDGYTAEVVPAVIVTPDSLDTTVKVAYHKISAVYSVDYQLANGTVVKNVSVTPERDGMIHLAAPQGYRLLTSVTDVQVVRGSQKLAVLVAPAEKTYTVHDNLPSGVTEPLIKTVTRTVKITMPNGHIWTVKQVVKFERTATVDGAGHATYSNWQAVGRAQFNKVFVPKRRGYHLVITDASGKALTAVEKINTVTAEMNDAVVNVKYVKD